MGADSSVCERADCVHDVDEGRFHITARNLPDIEPAAFDDVSACSSQDDEFERDPFLDWCAVTFQDVKDPEEEFTVVLLGQTGAGKTAFLDLMFNFPSVLRYGSEGVSEHVRDFHKLEHEVRKEDCMESQTRNANVYNLALGRLRFRIVDTPGLADTGGVDADRRHVKGIMDCVETLGKVHAFALVINGRQSRLTTSVNYVLTEFSSLLPEMARENILTVFTNCKNKKHCSFHRNVLNEVVRHEVSTERIIYIENPYSLFKNALEGEKAVPDLTVQQELVDGCKQASAELGKFFVQVAQMPLLQTAAVKKRYALRQDIEAYTQQCLEEISNMEEQRSRLAEHVSGTEDSMQCVQSQIRACQEKRDQLGKQLVLKVLEFETTGVLRDYAVLLKNQRDFVQECLEYKMTSSEADVSARQRVVSDLNEQLEIVKDKLDLSKQDDKVGWAFAMLGVESCATPLEVEWSHKQLTKLLRSTGSGNPERLRQADEAVQILREHLQFAVQPRNFGPGRAEG